MDDRKEILIGLGWHTLFAALLIVTSWLLFAGFIGDPDSEEQRFLALMCVVSAAMLVARPLAALLALPTGSLFYPRGVPRLEPTYSLAEAKRKRGQYEEALNAYHAIAESFPTEVRPYLAMMEIACLNLGDSERANAIAKRGVAMLRDDASRSEVLRRLRALRGKGVDAPTTPEGQSSDGMRTAESDVEEEY